MHHVNREITTKYKNMKLKYAEEQLKTGDLTEKLVAVTKELNILKDDHQRLLVDNKDTQIRE